ncbi:MAG TPA: 30S ribosome-binding factor RbfA [Acidobacteria bacterium]|nr:30S ribosome-binding factor RbfA [Acidobacteriota bacterium]HIM15317.1 30S ribosome-binding factor RbfA [Acidobacteriota bacterium]
MAHGIRVERVAERVRMELTTLLTRTVRDPAVSAVTITHVSMNADLQLARIYYTVLDGSNRRDTARGLRRAKTYLRRAIGQRLQLRHVPELRFMYDETLDQQDRLARIFTEIENQQPSPDQKTLAKLNDDASIKEHEP